MLAPYAHYNATASTELLLVDTCMALEPPQ